MKPRPIKVVVSVSFSHDAMGKISTFQEAQDLPFFSYAVERLVQRGYIYSLILKKEDEDHVFKRARKEAGV